MGLSSRKNIGAYLRSAYAAVPVIFTAGAGTSGAAQTGPVTDRFALGEPLSLSAVYSIAATLASGHTLSLAYKIQTGALANGSDMADYAVGSAGVVVLTGNVGGTAQTAVVKHDVDLNGAKQYVQIVYTATPSASSVDTASVGVGVVYGGMAELP
jgi:hypothetical protein